MTKEDLVHELAVRYAVGCVLSGKADLSNIVRLYQDTLQTIRNQFPKPEHSVPDLPAQLFQKSNWRED